jgi:hypothetical protein
VIRLLRCRAVLTSRSVVDDISVRLEDDESRQAEDDVDEAEGKDAAETDLLSFAELQAAYDEEGDDEDQ